MTLTDLFIKRPVLSIVVSLFIFLFGLNALSNLSIRQFPKMDNTVITVETAYPGANANLIAGFITTPLESALSSAEGVDYMTSSSTVGKSTITLNIKLGFNAQIAFTDIMSKVQESMNKLPKDAEEPVITKSSDNTTDLMYLSLNSTELTPQQMTDYATRVIKPQLETIDGVAEAEILGGQVYAMRIFMYPEKLAAYGLTPDDINHVIKENNFLTAAGKTKGEYVAVSVRANTDMHTAQSFSDLIVKERDGAQVKLSEVAKVDLGSQNYDSSVVFDDKKAIFIGIKPTPSANPLDVIAHARVEFTQLKNQFPPELKGMVVYDATDFIRASIYEVARTIIEACLIVLAVIYLFLGSSRAVLIPIVTIPLSIIGVCSLMYAVGYSINLLTLLAFVLAIGLVVDDAIVVVENIHRHIESGKNPLQAALVGAREIVIPIIAMTLTLSAVYTPIAFMTGLTGALFKEFAFTLASAVLISGVIALTLSPMMCSKLLNKRTFKQQLTQWIDQFFEILQKRYQNALISTLKQKHHMPFFLILVFIMLPFLYINTAKETAPEEDQGFFFIIGTPPQSATLDYIEAFTQTYPKRFKSFDAMAHYFIINSNPIMSGLVLKNWSERHVTQFKLKKPLQEAMDGVAGIKNFVIIPPALPGGGGGTPIQFVIKTTHDYESLLKVSEDLFKKARDSGLFIYLNNSLKFNQPEVLIDIDREKAAEMGINMKKIGNSLSSALSNAYINYFNLAGRSYEVIPQIVRDARLTEQQLQSLYIQSASGTMIPLSTFTKLKSKTNPNAETHFQQLNSATIEAVMIPGKTLGEGLQFLEQCAQSTLPLGFMQDYGGQSRQFKQESKKLMLTFLLAIMVIYLILAAQYESFRDPFVILLTVPTALLGALIPLNLGLGSINIYTQVGLITLIGLISKHGILIVDFANRLKESHKLDVESAVIEAASIRLRPILMTTAAMVFGVIPLLVASGAGAVSRFDIGLVIAVGLSIGTLCTLFVIPAMYTIITNDQPEQIHS